MTPRGKRSPALAGSAKTNRRQFLTRAALASGTGLAIAAGYASRQRAIRLALIGAGARGRQLARTLRWTRARPVHGEVVAICDADLDRARQLSAEVYAHARIQQDYRRVLESDDVQAVVIATPDHGHAPLCLAALQAGKAVYCEKPLTLTVAEGQMLVEEARRRRGILQVGSQQRSHPRFQTACELVRNGRLGKLERITITLPSDSLAKQGNHGPFENRAVPASLDWNLWLGQAPWVEFCQQRFDPFRWWFEYSGGFMTDWGSHHLDIAHWAMGLEQGGPISIDGRGELPNVKNGFNTPRFFRVTMVYPNDVSVRVELSDRGNGILFEGDCGRIFVNRARLSGRPVEELLARPFEPGAIRLGPRREHFGSATYAHLLNFLDCIETGETPISDVISQHRSASACHLANISMRLGRPLTWDPRHEIFPDDPAANAMLSRAARG